jgi:hypothetical protein
METTMNRAMLREAKKAERRKPARQDKTSINPVLRAVFEADLKKRFTTLKREAEQQCIASNDVNRVVYNAGFLLFITLRALEIDRFEIEDLEVVQSLAIMGAALGDMRLTEAIEPEARQSLITGMDYLDALVQVLSKEALALAWHQVDQACQGEGVGTHDLENLLSRLGKKAQES